MAAVYSLEQGSQKGIRHYRNLHMRILLQYIFYHRYRHGNIAHGRKPYDEYVLRLLHLFCLLLIQNRVQSGVVVHLHLFIHFHVLIAIGNIGE